MVRWPKWGKQDDQPDPGQPIAAVAVVHFTDTAHQKVAELLQGTATPERAALRISAEIPPFGPPAYGMALEESGEPRPDDVVIDSDGIRVLVDSQSLRAVDGATVDFVDDLLRPGFTVQAPSSELSPAPRPDLDLSDPLIAQVQAVIDQYINPGIASHGGRASLIDVKQDVVYVELGGGCQGCSMAAVTLKQGVEQMIKQMIPQVREVVDVTDHSGGSNPYYSGAKGGESPFHQAAKG